MINLWNSQAQERLAEHNRQVIEERDAKVGRWGGAQPVTTNATHSGYVQY
jgi:hypothetical protein